MSSCKVRDQPGPGFRAAPRRKPRVWRAIRCGGTWPSPHQDGHRDRPTRSQTPPARPRECPVCGRRARVRRELRMPWISSTQPFCESPRTNHAPSCRPSDVSKRCPSTCAHATSGGGSGKGPPLRRVNFQVTQAEEPSQTTSPAIRTIAKSLRRLVLNMRCQREVLFVTEGDGRKRPCDRTVCTPCMGVNLWGESPLYEGKVSRRAFYQDVIPIDRSTSRRQGRCRERGSEGSRRHKPRADEQKSHRRPGRWANGHTMTKPCYQGVRVVRRLRGESSRPCRGTLGNMSSSGSWTN
jgi:hypothetical protein